MSEESLETTPASSLAGKATVEALPLSVGSYKVIYLYTIPGKDHEGRVKVGDATLHTAKSFEELRAEATPEDGLYTSPAIEEAARARIDEQTKTADVPYELLGAYLAVRKPVDGFSSCTPRWESFRDYQVHEVLLRSGLRKGFARKDKKVGEWFTATPEVVKNALKAVVAHRDSISTVVTPPAITLRAEQEQAVKDTLKVFQNGTHDNPKAFLWNAIMRFGKTVTSYELVKKLAEREGEAMKRVLVLTHRPVVVDGWAKDFRLVFPEDSGWSFASKRQGDHLATALKKSNFFYFASMQDLRGSFAESDEVEENLTEEELQELFQKNSDVFSTEWDMVILDEAHEGLATSRAQKVFSHLKTRYKLSLSGTPFDLMGNFQKEHIYNWSYVDEQRAKAKWEEENPEKPNPYGSLPKLEIRAMNLEAMLATTPEVEASATSFNLARFFATSKNEWVEEAKHVKAGRYRPFTNPAAVSRLLDMLHSQNLGKIDPATGRVSEREATTFPYASDRGRLDFADTLWVLPTVKACEALEEMLNEHPYFQDFKVVNVTGSNDSGDPLRDVQEAIKKHERTITLTYGKLTVGTTVPEWTAVFMMSNTQEAKRYMQTIFRCKSSGSLRDGRPKETAYVFDFAPDRSLKMLVENAVAGVRAGDNGEDFNPKIMVDEAERELAAVEEQSNYLPVIIYDGSKFKPADTHFIMDTINRVSIDRAMKTGFYDKSLYDTTALSTVTQEELALFRNLYASTSKSSDKEHNTKNAISVAQSPLGVETRAAYEKDPKLNRREEATLTEEERRAREEMAAFNRAKNSMRITLRAVSVRLPLLLLGAPSAEQAGERITLANFADRIDDTSWEEFMPKGFAKRGKDVPSWESLSRFYNAKVFEGSVNALQERVQEIAAMPVMERVLHLTHLFSTFQNPDKETVLTPWRVVNLQYATTLGGLRWVNDQGEVRVKDRQKGTVEYVSPEEALSDNWEAAPEWVDTGHDDFWTGTDTTVLDINSKTALYPLYAAASLWWRWQQETGLDGDDPTLWLLVAENALYVNCRVPYSASIARRVLVGYDDTVRMHTSVVDVLTVRNHLKEATRKLGKMKDEVEEKVWRYVFTPQDYSSVEERVEVVMAADGEGLKKLAEAFGEETQKFSCVVSNPPYQKTVEGDTSGGLAIPIYQEFFEVSKVVAEKISLVHPARFIYGSGGQRFEHMRNELLWSNHVRTYFSFDRATYLFEGIDLPKGLCLYLYDKGYNGLAQVTVTNLGGVTTTLDRHMGSEGFSVFIPDLLSVKIVTKIQEKMTASFSEKVSKFVPFGLPTNARARPTEFGLPESFFESSEAAEPDEPELAVGLHDTEGAGIFNKKHQVFWMNKGYSPPRGEETISGYKLFTPQKYGRFDDGTASPVVGPMHQGGPNEICTESYVFYGPFATESEMKACEKYVKTRFMRFCAKINSTGSLSRSVFKSVPLENFSEDSDIDWTKSVRSIESQLYAKYGLDKQEQEKIEELVTEF